MMGRVCVTWIVFVELLRNTGNLIVYPQALPNSKTNKNEIIIKIISIKIIKDELYKRYVS